MLANKIVRILILRFDFLRMKIFKIERGLAVLAEIKINYISIIDEPVIQVRLINWDGSALFSFDIRPNNIVLTIDDHEQPTCIKNYL